jgi:ABC-type Fe3+/spermidine/putrescine transport system ATPase subunit
MIAADSRQEGPMPPTPATPERESAGGERAENAFGGGEVVLRDVTKRYGDTVAVNNLTLVVRGGEFLAVLGPSGSGKTTTMRIVGGFVRPDSGAVEIAGRNVVDLPPFRRDVNTVFQSYALFPHMSIEDNVGYGLRRRGIRRDERRRRVAEMLELVRLPNVAQRRPAELSGGMAQRVALARALVNRPSVLLLDEPLGALDRKLREDMQIELRQLHSTLGTTFIYVTHDQEEALSMSDRMVVMRDGEIEQLGEPAAVYDSPASLWVAGFVGAGNRLSGIVRSAAPGEVELETDVARIIGAHAHGELATGDRATAVIRPEELHVAHESGSGANRLGARVAELLVVGGYVKIVALTAGGIELLARASRASLESGELVAGAEIELSWRAEAVHVYPSEGAGTAEREGGPPAP